LKPLAYDATRGITPLAGAQPALYFLGKQLRLGGEGNERAQIENAASRLKKQRGGNTGSEREKITGVALKIRKGKIRMRTSPMPRCYAKKGEVAAAIQG